MGYVVDQKSQINSELGLMMPRLKAFASALTANTNAMHTPVVAVQHPQATVHPAQTAAD